MKYLAVQILVFLFPVLVFSQGTTPFYKDPSDTAKNSKGKNNVLRTVNQFTKIPLLTKITLVTPGPMAEVVFTYDSLNQLIKAGYKIEGGRELVNEYLHYDHENRLYMIVTEKFRVPDFMRESSFSIFFYDNNAKIISVARYNIMNQKTMRYGYRYDTDKIIRVVTYFRNDGTESTSSDTIAFYAGGKNISQSVMGEHYLRNLDYLQERNPTSLLPTGYNTLYHFIPGIWYNMEGNYNMVHQYQSGSDANKAHLQMLDYGKNIYNWLTGIRFIPNVKSRGGYSYTLRYEYADRK